MQDFNWDKLGSYSGDNKKSFEELCYQIVFENYQDEITHGAILTSIDDSGGGDGIEFYLTFPNGDMFGWQAKFFCRLSEGGRKEQIKKSLQTAYKKHPNLKKWFLCSQCNFTPDENNWFINELASSTKDGERVLADNNNVELIHWGASEFLNYLRIYPAIHKFFFSEKLLTQEWFEDRYNIDIKKTEIQAKYKSKIHINTEIDTAIYKVLGGNRLIEAIEDEMEKQQVRMYAEEYRNAFLKLYSEKVEAEYISIQDEFKIFLHDKENIVDTGVNILDDIKKLISDRNNIALIDKIKEFERYINELRDFFKKYMELARSELCNPIQYLRDNLDKDNESSSETKKIKEDINRENNKRQQARDIIFAPFNALDEYAIPSLEWCYRLFEFITLQELHISGEAGMGKTHIAFNIYENQILEEKQPAIFILAKSLYTEQSLENQLKDNLGFPSSWTFDDFLDVLEVTARINQVKLPIIIDGLNESAHWNTLWKHGLEQLVLKIKKHPHLVLITTYRTSYEEQLFPDEYFDYKLNEDWWKIKQNVRGFRDLTWEAINSYFDYYKIKLVNRSNAIGYFEHPLHLKLFCETKNPTREKEVKVSFQNEDLLQVFDEYIKLSNKNITTLLQELNPKYDTDFTENKLLHLAKYIWENNFRGIPRSKKLFTNDELRIFESENLLIFRDWNSQRNSEEIQFTYDLLGGYFISKYLVKTYAESYPIIEINPDSLLINSIKTGLEFFIPERATDLLENVFMNISKKFGSKQPILKFIQSKKFETKLLNKETEHPLFEDILRTISILLVKKENIFLFNSIKNDRAKKYSTESLFEINAKYIQDNDELIKAFLKTEFAQNKIYLLELGKNIEFDENHPLNFDFWSDLLKDLSIQERDLSWSEYIRRNHSWYKATYFSNFVEEFEKVSKKKKRLSNRIHFAAKKVMWVLTTTIRRLRDESTRALYYYARRYPREFFDLLKYSFDINDPYVLERMLAVSYGLAMARQNDYKDASYKNELLPQYARLLFDNLFSIEAKYPTTHMLARDYAKRTIEIALLHNPKILTSTEKDLIQYPLQNYHHKEWGKSVDKDDGKYRDGNAPMHMDFKNYTIGRLIKHRRNYDNNHAEYQEVLSKIYWRIYDLVYSLDKFGEIDKQIAKTRWEYSHSDNAGKIDRYGKKYSWIAYYEMAGYRSDLGLLKGWDEEDEFRISDVDIDPSFPIELKKFNIFEVVENYDFLGDEKISNQNWCRSSDVNIDEYIHMNQSFGNNESYDWVLLRGDISKKNKENQTRDINISINALLVNESDFTKLKDVVTKNNDYTFDYHRNIESHYLFDGEIAWCDLMPDGSYEPFVLDFNYRDIAKAKKELKILNNGKALTSEEKAFLRKKEIEYLEQVVHQLSENGDKILEIQFPFIFEGSHDNELTEKMATTLGYTFEYEDIPYTEKENDSIKIDIESTVFESSWESYHSEIIPSGETRVPAKKICQTLELFLEPQSSDMYSTNGELVATSFKCGKGYENTSVFTYIRKDYLDKYLKMQNKRIFWLQWVEKRSFPHGVKKLHHGERGDTEYRNYYKVIL
jgi:hypothetical protein